MADFPLLADDVERELETAKARAGSGEMLEPTEQRGARRPPAAGRRPVDT